MGDGIVTVPSAHRPAFQRLAALKKVPQDYRMVLGYAAEGTPVDRGWLMNAVVQAMAAAATAKGQSPLRRQDAEAGLVAWTVCVTDTPFAPRTVGETPQTQMPDLRSAEEVEAWLNA